MVAARLLVRPEHPEQARLMLHRLSQFQYWSADTVASMLAGVGGVIAPDLRDMLDDVRQPEWVRNVAALTLHKLADPEAADVAARILTSENIAGRTPALETALLKLLESTGVQRHLPIIRSFCRSEHDEVRYAAYRALASFGAREDIHRMIDGLDDSSNWVALAAARGLRRGDRTDLLRQLAAGDHDRAELLQQVLSEDDLVAL